MRAARGGGDWAAHIMYRAPTLKELRQHWSEARGLHAVTHVPSGTLVYSGLTQAEAEEMVRGLHALGKIELAMDADHPDYPPVFTKEGQMDCCRNVVSAVLRKRDKKGDK